MSPGDPVQHELVLEGSTNPPVPSALRGIVGLITPAELATALGVAEQTLAGWRCTNQGPAFVKLGKGVFYRLADIQSWIAASVTAVVTGDRVVGA